MQSTLNTLMFLPFALSRSREIVLITTNANDVNSTGERERERERRHDSIRIRQTSSTTEKYQISLPNFNNVLCFVCVRCCCRSLDVFPQQRLNL